MPELNGGGGGVSGIVNPAYGGDEKDEKTEIMDEKKAKDEVVNLSDAADKVADDDEEYQLVFEDLPEEASLLPWDKWKSKVEDPLIRAVSNNAKVFKWVSVVVVAVLYNAFFISAIVYNKDKGFSIPTDG